MEMNENFYSFLLQAQKKYGPNDPANLLKVYLDKCGQDSKGIHDVELEACGISRPRASEISRPSVSVRTLH